MIISNQQVNKISKRYKHKIRLLSNNDIKIG